MRISENARRTVVFFGAPSPKTGGIEYRGTGFLVTYKEENRGFGYLVTARHVAEKVNAADQAVVRLNTKDASSVTLEMDDVIWTYHPDPDVDVAVMPCNISQDDYDVGYYNLLDLVTRDSGPFRVQCGDPICIIGLFRLHSGSQRNVPIVHSGNIALLPDPKEPIPIIDPAGVVHEMEAYLVEAQTLEGLSGAPVFQREVVMTKLWPDHNGGPALLVTGAQLLGVYSGAWAGNPSPTLSDEKNLSTDRRVPVGMGIVVPGEKILEIIQDDPDLKKSRADILKAKQVPSVDSSAERESTSLLDDAPVIPGRKTSS